MADIDKLVKKLAPLEIKVLPFLEKNLSLSSLTKASGLKEVEVMRALQWLENKGALKTKVEVKQSIELDKNGKIYSKEGLPEKRLLNAIKDKEKSLDQIQKETKLEKVELNIGLGVLKKKAAIAIKPGMIIAITEPGKKELSKESLEEQLLKKLEKNALDVASLAPEEKFAYETLRKRREIIKIVIAKERIIELSELGKKLAKTKISADKFIDKITPFVITSGKWKDSEFRSYDVSINVPKVYGGKRQPYSKFLEDVRQKLINIGFVEMTGPIIETEFFNFDALFQPQNHPARTWSDTYRIKAPKYGDLPDKKIVDGVKAAHENGGKTGSIGWRYKWSETVAKQLMPRAHDTAISPRYMIKKDLKIPGKYFSLVRCFRPDVIDATHGVEFNQMGGIVIGNELSFKDLVGLLRDFVIEMTGAEEVKFFPDYFPFTEPSLQVSAKHPEFGWLELAGAGVFRPELSEPLGIKEPVIAWGFGIDRLAMLKLGIEDIRDLFSHNLKFLRESKL